MLRRQRKRDTGAARGREPVQRVVAALFQGHQQGNEDGLRCRAAPSAITLPDLAVDDRRADGLLGPPVRGIDRRIDQEPEPLDGMTQDVLRQASVRQVRESL